MSPHLRALIYQSILAFSSFLSTTGLAQAPATARAKPAARFAMIPFDTNQVTLPARFLGNDLAGLVAALADSRAKEKNEFETTEQFRRRLAKESTGPIHGSVRVGDLVAFVFDELEVGTQYDADVQQFHVSLRLESVQQGFEEIEYDSEALCKRTRRQEETYLGTNTFGAAVEVRKVELEFACARFDRSTLLRGTNLRLGSRSLDLRVAVPLGEARQAKDALRVLLVGRLATAITSSGAMRHEPKVDDPQDLTWEYRYIELTPTALWVFNQATGIVYLRTDLVAEGMHQDSSAPPKRWLEVGAPCVLSLADDVRERVVGLGFPQDRVVLEVAAGGGYRVLVGPFDDYAAAGKAARQLRQPGVPKVDVVLRK